jgi:hypothetical protein
MEADDPFLAVQPLGGVVGDSDDDFQVRRLDRRRRSRREREGEGNDEQYSDEVPQLGDNSTRAPAGNP